MAKQTKAQKARTGVTQDLLPFTDAINSSISFSKKWFARGISS